MEKTSDNISITVGIDVQENGNAVNFQDDLYKDFGKVSWQETAEGEIITDRPEYIPMIKEWIGDKPYKNRDTLRAFIEKYGGTWISAEECEPLEPFISNE